jgi:hypothetical protein
MSNPGKVILGIVTFLPLIFGASFIVYYISMIREMLQYLPDSSDPQFFARNYMAHFLPGEFVSLAVLSFVTHLGLMIYYIIHVVTHKIKSEGEKIMWILFFVFIGTVTFIIYYFMRVVPVPSQGIDNDIQKQRA